MSLAIRRHLDHEVFVLVEGVFVGSRRPTVTAIRSANASRGLSGENPVISPTRRSR